MNTIKVLMLTNWGNGTYVWLHEGDIVELPKSFARMLISQRKARFNGSALDLYHEKDMVISSPKKGDV